MAQYTLIAKQIIFFFLSMALMGCVYSQNTNFQEFQQKKQQAWAEYKDAKQKAWADFRNKLNNEYADKMSRRWTSFKAQAAIPVPEHPEPPKPVIKTNNAPVPTCSVSVKEFVPYVPNETIQPFQPIARPVNEQAAAFVFNFHNTPCKVHLSSDMYFTLPNVSEGTVSETWKLLSSLGYDVVADDCLNYREQLDLNDWGFIEMTKKLACAFCGEKTNEAVLVQAYLLVQSGYKTRLARSSNNKLYLLLPFTTIVYKYTYFYLDDEKYYLIAENAEGETYYIFNEKFTGEKTASLGLNKEPRFFDEPTSKKTFSSSRYPGASATLATNKNLIDFYNTCPVTSNWDDYARASLSRKIKRNLYPTLKKQISEKTELEAANILLNFVQTAFDYQTDQEQFGYERPLFGDELFYYPYSDCEDRSILFSILVRDLLHLDVVLLNYPGHLATAVQFSENVGGYYFTVNDKKYVLCDPTYIGAPVGDCMPQFVGVGAVIVEIGK